MNIVIKLFFLTIILLPKLVCGQNLRVRYESHRDFGRPLFSLLSSVNDSSFVETDGIFSDVQIGDDSGVKHAIASISVDRYHASEGSDSYKDYDITNDIWMCLNGNLRIRFYYPVGTRRAFPFCDGISLFSMKYVDGMMGAVDLEGNVIMHPKYDYIVKKGLTINGICDIVSNTDVVFKCEIFELGSSVPKLHMDVLFDDTIDRESTVHDRFSDLIDSAKFQNMIDALDVDNDSKMYLWGIHEMLNMNYESSLRYFTNIKMHERFRNLSENINLCKELMNCWSGMTSD